MTSTSRQRGETSLGLAERAPTPTSVEHLKPYARLLCAVLTAAGLALLLWHGHSLWFYTEDDAYIVARYARNLARGDGLVHNVGAREWGCTTTLLPLLLAPLYRLGVLPIVGAKVIGLLSAVLAALLVARITFRHAPPAVAAVVTIHWRRWIGRTPDAFKIQTDHPGGAVEVTAIGV